MTQAKWISSNTDLRYVGSGISISHSPSYTATKRFGFIMTMDVAGTCYSAVNPATTPTTERIFPSTFLVFTSRSNSNMKIMTSSTTSNNLTVSTTMPLLPLGEVGQIPFLGSCGHIPPAIISEAVSGTTEIHTTNTPSSYTFADFTTDVTCSNTAFTYSVET